ncbi:unnamed protein product, partial [Prorocentrum cordatum]
GPPRGARARRPAARAGRRARGRGAPGVRRGDRRLRPRRPGDALGGGRARGHAGRARGHAEEAGRRPGARLPPRRRRHAPGPPGAGRRARGGDPRLLPRGRLGKAGGERREEQNLGVPADRRQPGGDPQPPQGGVRPRGGAGGARRCRQGAGPGRGPGGGRQGGGGGLAAEHRGRPLVRRPPRGAAAQPGPRERVPPRDGDPAWYPELNSSQACADWCRQHAACAEATFSRVGVPEGGEQCRLFEARGELYDFRDDFNASWCGALEEVDHLLWEVKKLFEQKPWVGDNYGAHPCSFGGDDCSQTRCCGTQTCDWSFTSCEYFQCVRKDEYYAGCTDAPEAGWDGEVLGGGPNEDDLPRAEDRGANWSIRDRSSASRS